MNAPPAQAQGPAFPLAVRLLATALVAGLLLYGARVAATLTASRWTATGATALAAGLLLVLWCLYWIWRSRTQVDAAGIRQTWLWDKEARWDDVTQARLFAIPGLHWLIAPRLTLRLRGRPTAVVFHVGDAGVREALRRVMS